ncbi:hypothetical protein L1887_44948 [Cichorium endivia]|nr:hypothetical protein L1887_44948 [Cichorium endivia]
MEQIERILNKGYAVIRCHDGAIVARLNTFPDNKRALMYRHGGEVSFMTLQENEIVGTPTLFTLMLERAGYRIEAISLHVVGNDGIPLNAACKIGYEDGRFGFILESWGPKDRNREYNQALDLVIERLINIGVTKLKAYIASADLRENLPDIEG